MSVKKDAQGKWIAEVNKLGLKRVRRSFFTKTEAEQFERDYIVANSTSLPSSLPASQHASISDLRSLKDLAAIWFKYHGINLVDGVRRQECLEHIADALGNPPAVSISAEMWVNYRFVRMQAGLSAKTVNNHQKYVDALFNRLNSLGIIDYVNPIAKVDLIRIQERQLSYLSLSQINLLFESIALCQNESVWFVAQICLRTGARWGEAENLRCKQLHDGRVTFEFTKSKKTRTIPLDSVFYAQLVQFAVGKNPDDRLFSRCYASFRMALNRSSIVREPGQLSHLLRHSFASHFVMRGGNILSLQKILGHADISMTMRYAHLAPDHFQDALKFNPLV